MVDVGILVGRHLIISKSEFIKETNYSEGFILGFWPYPCCGGGDAPHCGGYTWNISKSLFSLEGQGNNVLVAAAGGSMVEVRVGDSSLVVEVVAENQSSILLGAVFKLGKFTISYMPLQLYQGQHTDSLAVGTAVAGIAVADGGLGSDDLSTDLGILQTF
jgi:hypothetical protein